MAACFDHHTRAGGGRDCSAAGAEGDGTTGQERKGKERKGKERKGKERKGRRGLHSCTYLGRCLGGQPCWECRGSL
eukprot:1159712-Pelagomonas_calceolata.AAC.4